MGPQNLDERIASYYAKMFLEPIKFGESATLFWYPGSGMTTIINDILNNKSIFKSNLGQLTKSIQIYKLWGHLTSKKNLNSLLTESGFQSEDAMFQSTETLLKEGTETVFILGRIDDYPNAEKVKILQMFVKLVSLNPRRVHLIFNTVNKPWFESNIEKHPETLIIANNMKIIPTLKDDLLKEYIIDNSNKYGFKGTEEEFSYIARTYGGILQLTKEYLRSYKDITNIEVKLRLQWDILPKKYKDIFKQLIQGEKVSDIKGLRDLEMFGVKDLELFSKHSNILDIDPEKKVLIVFTEGEKHLWEYFKKNSRKLVDKDIVTELLRPDSFSDTSLWAIDKAVSRFRKKLLKNGIDPERLRTVKGKGYIWQD
jgi:hypothetical protein